MFQQVLQTTHDVVGGFNQGDQFAWRICRLQRGQVAIRARLQLCAQTTHRTGRALHHHNHNQRNDGHQSQLPQQGIDQDLACQCVTQFQCLGDLHDRHRARLVHGHRLQQHRDAHPITLIHSIVKIHQGCIGSAIGQLPLPRWQGAKAVDQFTLEVGNPVHHSAAVIRFESFQGKVRYGGAQAGSGPHTIGCNVLADRLG